MGLECTILNSELEFRKFVISNYKDISTILIFEDSPNEVIYFYCFFSNNSFVATKENANNDYLDYTDLYEYLGDIYNLNIVPDPCEKVLRIRKK